MQGDKMSGAVPKSLISDFKLSKFKLSGNRMVWSVLWLGWTNLRRFVHRFSAD